MKMETIFLKYFFISFLIGIIISTLLVTLLIGIFTNNYYDKTLIQDVINLEKKYAEAKIKSANIKITSLLLKYQVNINELILFYHSIANDLLKDENSYQLESGFLISALSVSFYDCLYYSSFTETMAVWVLDSYANNVNVGNINKAAEQQLIAFSHLIVNLDAVYQISTPNTYNFFFYFEETELFISYPLSFDCATFNVFNLPNYYYSSLFYCTDENGFFYTSYKMKCTNFYENMMKSKTKSFDNNYESNQNKTIFLNNYFFTIVADANQEFVMCIQFEDPITKGKGYGCVNTIYNELVEPIDNLNTNVKGYFFVSNIGFNNVFYYPHSTSTGKIPTEYIFNWDTNYSIDEKKEFNYNIKKTFTSNYMDHIGDTEFEEVFVNGKNSSEQYFYINEELFNYSIYPIVLANIEGKKEHLFSVIYIYNNGILLESLYQNRISFIFKMIIVDFFI